MKRRGLKALIRLNAYRLDEKRRQGATYQAAHDTLVAGYRGIEREIIAEQQLAKADPIAATFYGAYAQATIERRARLEEKIAAAAEAVEAAREETREQFRETKKYELAEQHLAAADWAEAERRERIELDELALVMHRRKTADITRSAA